MWAVHENLQTLEHKTQDGSRLVTIFYEYKDAVKALAEVIDEIPNARISKIRLVLDEE